MRGYFLWESRKKLTHRNSNLQSTLAVQNRYLARLKCRLLQHQKSEVLVVIQRNRLQVRWDSHHSLQFSQKTHLGLISRRKTQNKRESAKWWAINSLLIKLSGIISSKMHQRSTIWIWIQSYKSTKNTLKGPIYRKLESNQSLTRSTRLRNRCNLPPILQQKVR